MVLLDLRIKAQEYEAHLPEPFWTKVAEPWFESMTSDQPVWAQVRTWRMMGPKVFLAVLVTASNHYHQLMETVDTTPASDNVLINRFLREAFGAATLMSVLSAHTPDWLSATDDVEPSEDIDSILDAFWHGPDEMDPVGVTMALRAAYNMFHYADE